MGDSAVGKTSLAKKFLGHGFVDEYLPTLGANFTTKTYRIGDFDVRVMIVDVAGQENFNLLRERYFVGASGVFLVFDVTRPFDAEDQIKPWVHEVMEYTNHQGLPLAILANKIDLRLLRNIETFSGINAAAGVKSMMGSNVSVQYFETSAKEGTGVQEAFEWLIQEIIHTEILDR